MAAMHGGDPGWGHALRTGWRDLLVPLPMYPVWRAQRAGRDSLTALRIVFLSGFVTQALVVHLTWVVHRDGGEDGSLSPTVFLAILVAYGAFDLFLLAGWALRKTPEPEVDAEGVAAWFRAVTFLGYGLTQAVFLVGFVGSFVTGEWAMVLAGLPFAALGFWLVAPTRRRLAGAQLQLAREGMSVDLVAALLASPFRLGDAGRLGTRSGGGTGTQPPS